VGGVVPALIAMLKGRSAGAHETAAGALGSLGGSSSNEEVKSQIAAGGVVPALIAMLKGRSAGAQEAAAGALSSMGSDDRSEVI
jgi:HEAT repeat protein